MARDIGDKLGPRLVSLFTQHHLAVRSQLAPIEARIRAAGTQEVIDRAGRETADHYRGIINELLKLDPDMPPWLLEYLQQTAAGTHQWRSIAGVMGLTGITGGLSTIMTNYLAPAVQELTAASPQLQLDQNAAASATAAHLIDPGYGAQLARQAGFGQDQFDVLVSMAQTYPDAATLYDLMHRQLLNFDQAATYLSRNGIPDELIEPLIAANTALLSPADAALAVLRGNMSQADGQAAAAASGVSPADFQVMIGNTGEPPAIEEMLMLWRRGQMDTPTLERAIQQSRVRDEWIPYMLKLAVEPPTAADVIDALVQGQISQQEAEARYAQAGGDPTYFQTAYSTSANAPAPVQLAEMANRGIIGWAGTGPDAVTWQQGFLEGRWKDKWMDAFKALAVYHPAPREISTLVKEGGMTQDQALSLWQQAGLTPEMAGMYWQAAHYSKTTTLHELAASEIVKLYTDKAITRDEAMAMLESVNWTPMDANYQLDLADMALERKFLESAISKIHSLYVAHKLARNGATAALATLDVPASQVDQLIKTWDLEAADNVKTLTASQIADAVYYQLASPDEASTMLQQEGYTPLDAWYVLCIRNHGPIDGFPKPA